MKVLFATTNLAKIKRYSCMLKESGIELMTLFDIDAKVNFEEDGKDAIENAKIKAKAYFELTKLPVIGMDNTLFIEGIDESLQPGTHVRRIGGKTLNDDEMIDYYIGLVKRFNKNFNAMWMYGMAIYTENGIFTKTWSKGGFYFTDKVCKLRNPGYPLDSVTISSKYNKYLVELTREEKNDIKGESNDVEVVNFILESLNKK